MVRNKLNKTVKSLRNCHKPLKLCLESFKIQIIFGREITFKFDKHKKLLNVCF